MNPGQPPPRGWFARWRSRPAPGLTAQLTAPALVCSAQGEILEANDPAQALLAAHGMGLGQLPPEAWPPLDGRLVAEALVPQASLQFSRHALADGRWLVLPRLSEDATLTSRLFRSTHELLARVIATVAHDLRSPLASLFFNVGVLRKRWSVLEPEQVEATLEAMARACELEMKTVAALVERIDAGAGDGLSLGDLFDRITELMNPLFRGDSNQLEVSVDRTLEVEGASLLLDQIFVNLIGNAVESRPEAVRVQITSRVEDNHTVCVRVTNDGPPVDNTLKDMIFRPFFTTKSTGTGMGLSFAREAARQLGGDLTLAGGAPTTFEVRLRLRRAGTDT